MLTIVWQCRATTDLLFVKTQHLRSSVKQGLHGSEWMNVSLQERQRFWCKFKSNFVFLYFCDNIGHIYYFGPQRLGLLHWRWRDRLCLLAVAPITWPAFRTSYRDKLLQAALGEDAKELWPQRPLCKDGKHNALQNHGLGALKQMATHSQLVSVDHEPGIGSPFTRAVSPTPTATLRAHHHHHYFYQLLFLLPLSPL